MDLLDRSLTAFHACSEIAKILEENSFTQLKEGVKWNLEANKGYYLVRNGSSLIAFKCGEGYSFNIVASHSDSPCFKLKTDFEMKVDNYRKFNVEKYGGGIFYSWLDRPLTVAGRLIVKRDGELRSVEFSSSHTFIIPSLAIHFNRTVNDGVKLNPQVDLSPIESILNDGKLDEEIKNFANGEVVDADLYLVCSQKPFTAGADDELISSPRIDNLTSVFSSVEGLIHGEEKAINVVFIADNEEVGSRTKQGAGSKFLYDTLLKISLSMGKTEEDLKDSLNSSFLISSDNAHAVHPNHPELSDPANRVLMGKGVVIKKHAGQNYTTDGFSSAIVKQIFDKAGVSHQDFFMRSDLPCGGTLGAISSSQLSIKSADIGLGQLAMHSAVETFAFSDFEEEVKGLTLFYSCSMTSDGYESVKIDF